METHTPLKWILNRTKKFIPIVLLVTLIHSLSACIGVIMALISKNVLDSNGSKDKLLLFGGLLIGAIILNVFLTALSSVIDVRLTGKLIISLRNHMFSTLVHKKYKTIAQHHTGDLLNRFTSDIDVVVSMLTTTFPTTISTIFKIIVGIGVLIYLNPIFALIVFLIGTLLPSIGRLISNKFKYLHKEVLKSEGETRSFLQESFANIVMIKSFGSEAPILYKLNQYMNKNLQTKISRNFISVVINFIMTAFFNFGYYGVMIWGAFNFSSGLTYGTLNAFLQLINQLRNPLQSISGILPKYYSAIASAERLIEFENIENEPEPMKEKEAKALTDAFEKISIKNLAFAYEDELILQNCSFEVEKGKITALTGESGCGKSTIFKLLLGLYEPSGGEITINGNIPVDAATRPLFSYVPQGNMILSGTIRENITMCNNSISDERVIKAAKAADIYDLIQSLPDGLDTVLAERGAGLSEGQIQRISIARALLFDAPILLLDEATSALDEATETTVLANIKNLTDKTVLFITHRNTSISVCDRIIHAENKKFTVVK